MRCHPFRFRFDFRKRSKIFPCLNKGFEKFQQNSKLWFCVVAVVIAIKLRFVVDVLKKYEEIEDIDRIDWHDWDLIYNQIL